MPTIIQGDNGIVIPFTASKPKSINLEGANVEVSVKRGDDLLIKPATIVDAANGKCEFTLSSFDLSLVGIYFYQWTAKFPDGTILSGKKQDIYVSEKLVGEAPTIDAGTFLSSGFDATYDGGGF